ncbi:uncharacterized protein LOC121739964 [Aricia agestis]|uniref:uncharacterized protein LOC121739964 n=1 Tax=Aricia agestis TaxID=91739 RepID=UPI001C2042C5|nr:uncharacterized protein LOC121739964 [Aricia agestis]
MNKSNPPAYQENLQIPLINGNIMNIPLTSINISEEMNKTGIWKQVNDGNKMRTQLDVKDLKPKSAKKVIKHKKIISKNAQSEIERRLSTMDEVEEEDSLKADLLRRSSWTSNGVKNEKKKCTSAETSV